MLLMDVLDGDCRSEALYMDPQHRLLLEATVDVLQSASAQIPEATGVVVGIGPRETPPDYSALPTSQYSATGSIGSVATGR